MSHGRSAAFCCRSLLRVAEEFVSPAGVTVDTPNDKTVIVHLPKRVIAIGKVFDEIAIEPPASPLRAV